MRRLFDWIVAVVVATVVSTIVQTQFNIAAITGLGVEVTVAERLRMVLFDLHGFAPLWALVVAVALLFGFAAASLLAGRLPAHTVALYAVAGGMALLSALVILDEIMPMNPVPGARTIPGVLLMAAGGVLAGALFARLGRDGE